MSKKVFWILGVIALIPIIFYCGLFGLLYWDSLGYKEFQKKVKVEFESLKIDQLELAVCHEWKCTFSYKDPKMEKYGFSIFGEKGIKKRLKVMQGIYSDFDSNRDKCRYIQDCSNMCQL